MTTRSSLLSRRDWQKVAFCRMVLYLAGMGLDERRIGILLTLTLLGDVVLF